MMKRTNTERTCIVCRKTQDCDDMIRFVVGPDREIMPDLKRKLPGRGVWICGQKEHVAQAIKQNAFARGFKLPVKADQELLQILDQMLVKSALNSLSLAKKAGEVVSGFTKVCAALKSGKVIALLHSANASSDGIRKVTQALKQAPNGSAKPKDCGQSDDCEQTKGVNGIKVFTLFNANELGFALGIENATHVALQSSGAGRAFIKRVHALVRYRGGTPEVEKTS
jgi:predicted RNA-binding protein YlxR (DUF448 family)